MAILQSNSGTITSASFNVTLPSAPAATSRVVLCVAGNTIVNTPTGFTLRDSQVNLMGHYLFDIAGDGTTSSWAVTATSGDITWVLLEVKDGAFVTSGSANSASDDTTEGTPTITPSSGTREIIASIGSTTSGSNVRTVSGWTNSFVEIFDLCNATNDYPMQGVAVLDDVAANGSTGYSTTTTFSAASAGRTAIIAAYATSAASTPAQGSASGTITWAGSATGVAPAVLNDGAGSGAVTWAGSATGTNRPAVPGNLQATAVSSSEIDLTWDAVSGATGYDIERDGVVIVFGHATTSYSDTGRAPSTQYDYRVRAVV